MDTRGVQWAKPPILAPNPAQQKVGLGRHDPITLVGQVGIAQGRVGPKKTTHRAIDLAHHAIVLASRVGPSCLSVMLFHRADLLGPFKYHFFTFSFFFFIICKISLLLLLLLF